MGDSEKKVLCKDCNEFEGYDVIKRDYFDGYCKPKGEPRFKDETCEKGSPKTDEVKEENNFINNEEQLLSIESIETKEDSVFTGFGNNITYREPETIATPIDVSEYKQKYKKKSDYHVYCIICGAEIFEKFTRFEWKDYCWECYSKSEYAIQIPEKT